MARTEKYYIGPALLGDIRRVVGRVDGEPYGSEVARIATRLQDMPRPGGGGGGFRICTFEGAWPIGTQKTIQFRGTTNTVSATNLFASVSGECGERDCAIARDGEWYLVAVQCE